MYILLITSALHGGYVIFGVCMSVSLFIGEQRNSKFMGPLAWRRFELCECNSLVENITNNDNKFLMLIRPSYYSFIQVIGTLGIYQYVRNPSLQQHPENLP